MRDFNSVRCLVLGAASGIGAAVLERLWLRAGAVVGADRDATRLPPAGELLSVDVLHPTAVRQAVTTAHRQMGGLDVVVNTAGILGPVIPSSKLELADFERVVQVNLMGAFLVSQAALPLMADGGFGRLLHFSSTAGKEGVAGMTAAYSAAKAGIMGLVKSLAKEVAEVGVTVNAMAPGKVDTPLLSDVPASPEDIAGIPVGRLGTVNEAAALVEYVVSPEAAYTTGQVFDLSGERATW